MEKCNDCLGEGLIKVGNLIKCKTCKGTGKINTMEEEVTTVAPEETPAELEATNVPPAEESFLEESGEEEVAPTSEEEEVTASEE